MLPLLFFYSGEDFQANLYPYLVVQRLIIIYLFIGKRVFENTNEILYNNLMTFFIFLYGLLLIHFYFKF